MRSAVALAALLLAGTVALAQQPAPAPPPPDQQPIDTSTVEKILAGDEEVESGAGFTYDPAGRRDPFRSLLSGLPREEMAQRPPGLRGMCVEEIKLQGIFKLPEGYVAMIRGTDNLSYLLRAGTVLYDGSVESIEKGRVTFKLQIADPKSLKPYREVVRTLE